MTASRAGDYDAAIAKFNEAATLLPACFDCYYNIGYAERAEEGLREGRRGLQEGASS